LKTQSGGLDMNAKWATRIGLLASSVVGWLVACWVTTQTALPHLAVGASVTSAGWFAQVVSLISASGLSLATVIAFVKQWSPVVQNVLPGIKLPDLTDPKAEKLLSDTVELGLAVTAYLAAKDDKGAQRRFALAAITELGDMAELKSPAIAAALSQLGAAMATQWFPAPVQVSGVQS
jgi:hypothetical protein